MNTWFGILTVIFVVVSAAMILVILVQRPSGGGLAGAFGGAGGGGTDTVFGGRVGDALTVITVIAFVAWLGLAVSLNLVESSSDVQPVAETTEQVSDPTANLPGEPTSTPGGSNPGPIRVNTGQPQGNEQPGGETPAPTSGDDGQSPE